MSEYKDKSPAPPGLDEQLGRAITRHMAGDTESPCPSAEDIAAAVEGTLPPQEKNRLLEHISACDDCYDTFTLTSQLYLDSQPVKDIEPEPVVPMEAPEKKPGKSKLVYLKPLALAASLVVVVFSFYIYYKSDAPKTAQEMVLRHEKAEIPMMEARTEERAKAEDAIGFTEAEEDMGVDAAPVVVPKAPAPDTARKKGGDYKYDAARAKKSREVRKPESQIAGEPKKNEGKDRTYGKRLRDEDNPALQQAPLPQEKNLKAQYKQSYGATKQEKQEALPMDMEQKQVPPVTNDMTAGAKKGKSRGTQPESISKEASPRKRVPPSEYQRLQKLKRRMQENTRNKAVVQGQAEQVELAENKPGAGTGAADKGDTFKSSEVRQSPVQSQALMLNTMTRQIKTTYIPRRDMGEIFKESVSLSQQLGTEINNIRNNTIQTPLQQRNIDNYLNELKPLLDVRDTGEEVSIYPDVDYFFSRTDPASPEYRFFALARSGWCDGSGTCFQLERQTRATHVNSLRQWQQLEPQLSGVFKTIATHTINHLQSPAAARALKMMDKKKK